MFKKAPCFFQQIMMKKIGENKLATRESILFFRWIIRVHIFLIGGQRAMLLHGRGREKTGEEDSRVGYV